VVRSDRSGNALTIVAQPNHSSTWRANKLALLAIAVPSLGAAVGMAAAGAWPVLPFAGLEMAALGSALYYVNWKLQYRQVITLSDDTVRVEKGHYVPKRSWQLQRAGAALAVTPERHPWESPRLCLYSAELTVPIGEFLNREECLSLLRLLRGEMRVGTHAPSSRLPA
jgi:uncharacterized membrane protein